MHIYNKNLNGERHTCEVCKQPNATIQHHVYGRRYSDECIWVHDSCHKAIHNPTAYDLEPDWSYKNGYLLRNKKLHEG